MINASLLGAVLVSHGEAWSTAGMRAAFDHLRKEWLAIGTVPSRLAAVGDGIPKDYAAFPKRRADLEANRFATIESFSMTELAEGGASEIFDWTAYAIVIKRTGVLEFGWTSSSARTDDRPPLTLFSSLRREHSGRYGYLFRQAMGFGPKCYALGLSYGNIASQRTREHELNISWWGHTAISDDRTIASGLLRDIYPRNFLSDPYLDAPIGRTAMTLREWIEDNPDSRGSLGPFTETLTEWRPPVDRIPAIREALYRAGRVFYWRFYCPEQPGGSDGPRRPEPLFRPNLADPWEAPEPIPEIYRASYYADKDPGLIY